MAILSLSLSSPFVSFLSKDIWGLDVWKSFFLKIVLAIILFAWFKKGILISVLSSDATISLNLDKKSNNSFFFLPKRLKNPINSALEISLSLRGSFNLSKKWFEVKSSSTGSNWLSANVSSCFTSFLSIFSFNGYMGGFFASKT